VDAVAETATIAASQAISPATARNPGVEAAAVVVTPSSATSAKGLVTSPAIAELEPSSPSSHTPHTHCFEIVRPSVDLK